MFACTIERYIDIYILNFQLQDKTISYDFNEDDNDPTPRNKSDAPTHGTRCGGAIAMAANNTHCGVGIAYNSRIGGKRPS